MVVRTDNDTYFYHLTLKKQTNYIHSCIGHFIDTTESNLLELNSDGGQSEVKKHKVQESQICIATESHIELYDVEDGSLQLLASIPVFAIITNMKSIKAEKYPKTLLVFTSDAGVLTIARFVNSSGKIQLETIFNEPLGRSGIRRISPIAYLNVDPRGRCMLVSAMEKYKLCFLFDYQDGNFEVSSPIEMNRNSMITLDSVSCDVSYDNPCFCSIEIDTSRNNDFHLLFYVLNLSLNHIMRKAQYKIKTGANFLMSLPDLSKYGITTQMGHAATYNDYNESMEEINPFVVIGYENYILLKDMLGLYSLKIQIPRKDGHLKTTIISSSMQKMKNNLFILLQSNHGDLFKLEISANVNDRNRPMATLLYFDTLNQSGSMHIFKNGCLYANSEIGNNYLLQFESLGNENDQSNKTSSLTPEVFTKFESTKLLQNLSIIESQQNLNPIQSCTVTAKLPFSICIPSNNHLKYLKNGVEIEEMISTPLSNHPKMIWSIRLYSHLFHKWLFLGFENSLIALTIDNDSIEQFAIDNSGFQLGEEQTILVAAIGENSIVQVCKNEMIQVFVDPKSHSFQKSFEWYSPAGIHIISATATKTQLALSLSNCEIIYFQIEENNQRDTLIESQRRLELEEIATSISFQNSINSKFLAAGLTDSTVKLISLEENDHERFFKVISMQAVQAQISDVKLITSNGLELHIGLVNGVYVRSRINERNGEIYDSKTKYLGSAPVKLSNLPTIPITKNLIENEDSDEEDEERNQELQETDSIQGNVEGCIVAHSTKTWISYTINGISFVRPILLEKTDKFVSVSELMTTNLNHNSFCALNASGSMVICKFKKFVTLDEWLTINKNVPVLKASSEFEENSELDSNDEEEQERTISANLYRHKTFLTHPDNKAISVLVSNDVEKSCCYVTTSAEEALIKNTKLNIFHFEIKSYLCLSAALWRVSSKVTYLVLSTNKNSLLTYQLIYKYDDHNKVASYNLKLLHETLIEDKVYALIAFDEFLLVPIFGNLVMFGCGKKQLLKKHITKCGPSITKVTALGCWNSERLAIGDARESVTLLIYDKDNKNFIPIADDVTKRHVTSLEFLDESTVIGGDKFSNIWVLRLPKIINSRLNEALTAIERDSAEWQLHKKFPNVFECLCKFENINHYFINDIPTKFQVLESVQNSDRPVIIYTGLQGSIGCLIPLLSKNEITTLQEYERVMSNLDDLINKEPKTKLAKNKVTASEDTNSGVTNKIKSVPEGYYSRFNRDHTSYRSYNAPVKQIIDGDLLETFMTLTKSEQASVCQNIRNCNSRDYITRITEIRINNM